MEFHDPDGFYTRAWLFLFVTIVNAQKFDDKSIGPPPRTALDLDLLKAELKGMITVVHPTQDDAVLFFFKQVKSYFVMSFDLFS